MAIGTVEESWSIDAGGEVLKVVSAIVTAFSIAADTLDAIRTRKEGNQRKPDHDVEELLKMKILWKSLSEVGEMFCETRRRRVVCHQKEAPRLMTAILCILGQNTLSPTLRASTTKVWRSVLHWRCHRAACAQGSGVCAAG